MVTGHIGTTETLEEEAEGRNFAMLKKPISLAEMVETLESLLQSL